MKKNHGPNSLINETSPYLLQHAHNPVDWHPWSADALDLARRENKPVLLSIGYSACHWCHVMAHESFEDDETARLMNEYFINIKVDREERPDLDKIYQTAQQLLTGRSGGWPLTLFLTPDEQIPFFGGTYFPPESRYGMPGFRDILRRVAGFYHEQADAIHKQNESLMEALARMQVSQDSSGSVPDAGPLHEGVQGLINSFDSDHGGFGGAPKFPQVSNLELLLNYACLDHGDTGKTCLDITVFTLEKMAGGGIYDHLAGGFSRYSVDDTWMIPHFEKMLYDNGPLLAAYSQAWHLTGNIFIRQVAEETANWILTDMQAPSGGFYSSLDADSEGEEGKFYVWTRDEVASILDNNEYEILAQHYGLAGAANFEGKWHLRITTTLEQVAINTGTDINEARRFLDSARNKLLAVRRDRIWPERDEKVLVSWNALTIKGMAIASVYLDSKKYYHAAEKSLVFIHDTMWRDGRLLASSKDGKAHLNAYLDDYAYLLDAIITLLAVQWQGKWLDFAFELANVLLNRFYNPDIGGFFFTSHDHEKLLQRRQDFMDDATPSGNGVAARALLQLGHLTGRQDYIDAASATIAAAWSSIQRIPHAHNSLLLALADMCFPPRQIIIRGTASASREWQRACYLETDIRTAVFAIPDNVGDLKGLLAEKTQGDRTVAYLCEGFSCQPPYIDLENLLADLKTAASR